MSTRHVTFSKRRTRCPECNSSDGFAGLVSIDGVHCGDPLRHGKCHACDAMIWPDDAPSEPSPYQKTERGPAAIVGPEIMQQTSGEDSSLHRVLINIGGPAMASHLRQWNVGTDAEGWTAFHLIDARGHHRTTKRIQYDSTGHRIDGKAGFGVRLASGKMVHLGNGNGHERCLFGEHWLADGAAMIDHRDGSPRLHSYDSTTPIVFVESEKTAVVASFMMPQWVWIATGGVNGLSQERAAAIRDHLRDRIVLIMFDCDDKGREHAAKVAQRIADAGGKPIHQIDGKPVQDHVFTSASDGYDFGDYVMQALARKAADDQTRSTLRISEGAA